MALAPRTIRTLAALLTAPVLLLAVACGDDGGDPFGVGRPDADASGDGDDVTPPGDFEASPTYLRSVVENSNAQPYRFEMWMAFGADADTSRPPLATGEQDGENLYVRTDMGVMFAEMGEQMGETMPPEMAGMDLTAEMMTDGTNSYTRMPFLAEIVSEFAPPGAPEADLFAAFADWVYIDVSRLTDGELEELEALMGDQTVEPDEFLEILMDVESARDLEPTEVRGEMMNGIAAEVTVEDLLAAQGVDLEAEAPGFTPGDEFRDLMDTTADISTWVDSDGYVRRMSFTIDYGEMLADQALAPHELAEFEMLFGGTDLTIVTDLYDYGDPGISIEFPADAIDITDDIGLLSPGF